MYKCPYCNKDSYSKSSQKQGKFADWLAVRQHISRCLLNDKQYMICEFYGPIHIDELNKCKSIDEFRRNYPNLSFKNTFFTSLRKHDKTSLRKMIHSNESIIESIKDFYKENNRIPECRDFELTSLKYPDYRAVIRYFGSWNAAIEAAGFKPNTQNGFGTNTIGVDGHLYRSKAEAKFVELHLFKKYNYVIEPKYPDPFNLIYDWYIPELDLYIELDGGLRPQVIQEKIEINKKLGRKLLIIPINKINNKNIIVHSSG